MVDEAVLNAAPENELIRNTMKKADLLLNSYKNPVCSVSGGSDSDVMLDLLERVRGNRKVTYVFFDTGIEYRATLRHLDDLEAKYGIEIVRRKAKKPVPVGCKEYGVPFFSKEIAQKISYLQAHGFRWENEPFEVLNERYTGCKAGLKWWTGENGERSKFSIYRHTGMKEFMLSTPPEFAISDKCCNGAKKNSSAEFLKECNATICIVGERRAEGGIRAMAHTSCFEPLHHSGVARYMPLYFWSDEDKAQYKAHYGLRYSDCYEVYGMRRTGCCGCPFNSRFEEDLEIVKQYEPQLYKAAIAIFGKSYEYTRAYRKFRDAFKRAKRKGGEGQTWIDGV